MVAVVTAMEHLGSATGEFREMKMQPSLDRAFRHKEILGAWQQKPTTETCQPWAPVSVQPAADAGIQTS